MRTPRVSVVDRQPARAGPGRLEGSPAAIGAPVEWPRWPVRGAASRNETGLSSGAQYGRLKDSPFEPTERRGC